MRERLKDRLGNRATLKLFLAFFLSVDEMVRLLSGDSSGSSLICCSCSTTYLTTWPSSPMILETNSMPNLISDFFRNKKSIKLQ